MTVIPCFWNSAIVWSRKRACSTSAELPARTVYVRSSKQRDSAAVFLMSTPGTHGGVAARTGNARRGDGTSCDDGAAVEPSMAIVRRSEERRVGKEWESGRAEGELMTEGVDRGV